MFYPRESEAAATNVLSVGMQSGSYKCFICANAKRQLQMFYLRESEAAAAKRPSRNGNQLLTLAKIFSTKNLAITPWIARLSSLY
ncbi:hypothetical protein [Lysinibacillus sp. Bpr_S20]|uniref:hypothetical protein n=1 Tax=Lysinibacillus sp. Bpr_S20 TaxID=2933964 RepID=UPI002012EBBD|nr:hypothetical protein [Lysinibacillus sp. Bpr_S20]